MSETMPNDTFRINSEVMLRLAPLLAPIMHRVNVFVHFFFVPNRLLWKDWETFITGGRLGAEVTTPPVPPYLPMDELLAIGERADAGSLADYLGLPNIPDADAATWGSRGIDLMPFAACYQVWYDYYRDRNYYADNEFLPLDSGSYTGVTDVPDAITNIYNRAWQHDYFTSALPFTQRGAEVLMPLQGTGTVTYLEPSEVWPAPYTAKSALTGGLENQAGDVVELASNFASQIRNIDEVNLTSSDVSINDLRRAVRLQEWLERNALAGSRYNESIMAHFGRKTSDSRLQRAEYLGGGKVAVQISEVLTTAFSQDAEANLVPPGNMQGHGLTFGNTNKVRYNCEEHGFIVGFMSVMPTSGYMQGAPRYFFQRNTFLDYPWPSFAHLGEQEVYNSEIYADPTSLPVTRADQPIFGYQSRYADWKHMHSSSHGDFRSSLDFWHLTRKFASQPVLGQDFVTFEDALQDRVFAVSDVDTLWCYIYNNVSVVRSLPYFGTPML